MDIAFHYYAVKAVARAVGIPESDAQLIASYSQFVDDFNRFQSMWFSDLPARLKTASYVKKGRIYWEMNPVTTGFMTNNLSGVLDYGLLTSSRVQAWVVAPFHFPSRNPLNTYPGWNGSLVSWQADYRTEQAWYGDGSVISTLLTEACNALQNAPQGGKREHLIRIGSLLHVFADTCAHQRFSAFEFWRNDARVVSATTNNPETDVTDDYQFYVAKQAALPAIGHVTVSHLPDEPFARLTIASPRTEAEKKAGTRTEIYQRNNTLAFLDMAKEIGRYLAICFNKPLPDAMGWDDLVRPKLLTCFQKGSANDLIRLRNLYTEQFDVRTYPDIVFAYDATNFWPRSANLLAFSSGVDNADFFDFAYWCGIARDRLVGEAFPR